MSGLFYAIRTITIRQIHLTHLTLYSKIPISLYIYIKNTTYIIIISYLCNNAFFDYSVAAEPPRNNQKERSH